MKKCPYCAEEIQDDAIKCRHCGEWLNKGIEIKNKNDSNLIKSPPLPQGSKSSISNTVKPWYKNGMFICIIIFISIFIILSIYGLIILDSEGDSIRYDKSTKSNNTDTKPEKQKSALDDIDQTAISRIRNEIREIPKQEYGLEPSSPCRDEKSPGGEGYYMVGGGLIGQRDLAIAVYNARKYCQFRFKSSNTSYCLVGVDMAIRNMTNLKKCYKSKFNKEVPTTTSVNKKPSSSKPSDAEIDALAERIYQILQ